MSSVPRYPWDTIRLEYVAGYQLIDPISGVKTHTYPTHKDICEKYGCSIHTVQEKSKAEKWSESRKYFAAKFREKATQDQVQAYISDSASFDAMTVDKLKKLYRLVDAYLSQYDNIISEEAISQGTVDIMNLPEGVTLKVKDLLDLTNVLDRCQALIRRTVGEPIHNDDQFKEMVNDMAQASKIHVNNIEAAEQQIEAMNAKRESYKKAEESIRKEMEAIKKELENEK